MLPNEARSNKKKCSQSARCVVLGNPETDLSRTVKVTYQTTRQPCYPAQNPSGQSPGNSTRRRPKDKIRSEISELDQEIAGIGSELQH